MKNKESDLQKPYDDVVIDILDPLPIEHYKPLYRAAVNGRLKAFFPTPRHMIALRNLTQGMK